MRNAATVNYKRRVYENTKRTVIPGSHNQGDDMGNSVIYLVVKDERTPFGWGEFSEYYNE